MESTRFREFGRVVEVRLFDRVQNAIMHAQSTGRGVRRQKRSNMAKLIISVMGPFAASLDGSAPLGFISKKAQALLAYVAVESARPHTRDELAGLLWPDFSNSSAHASLRSALANVRQVIRDKQAEPSFLLVTRDAIQFNVESRHELDAAILERTPVVDTLDSAEAHRLECALEHIQGPLLAGFSMGDSPAFEEWLLLKREFYGLRLSELLCTLACYHEKRFAYVPALVHARRWVELNPWHEEAHQQVMRLLALQGKRSHAIAQFDLCRRVLREELDVEPGEATMELAERIRRGELSNAPEVKHPLFAPHRPLRSLIPIVGRKGEIAQLIELLADPARRLITIAGAGGMGKSHLAMEIAALQEHNFQHGAAIVPLAGLQSPDGIPAAVAHALDLSISDHMPVATQVKDYLSGKHLLLVMDNFEHLLEGVHFVEEWLKSSRQLVILATSRVRLHLQGEQLFRLDALSFPVDISSTSFDLRVDNERYDAITLFIQSVQRVKPHWRPIANQTDIQHIFRICQYLHGMPLAIVLAAAWIESLSLAEIVAELERGLDILRTEQPMLPVRHRNITTVFEQSWRLLTIEEQMVFEQFSVFCSGCTRSAAESVTGATLAQLYGLTSKFFLSQSIDDHGKHAPRFFVHELLRQFAAQKLSERQQREPDPHTLHSVYYAGYLASREKDLKGRRQVEAMAEIEADAENIRAAWQWAVDHHSLDLLAQSAHALGYFYAWRGRYQEGEALFQYALSRLPAPCTGEAVRLRICLLRWVSHFCSLLGKSSLAAWMLQQGFSLLESDIVRGQELQIERGALLFEQGRQEQNVERAQQCLVEACELFRTSGHRWELAACLHQLGGKFANQPGSDDLGQAFYKEALEIFLSLGDRSNACDLMADIAFSNMLRGEHAQGEALAKQALEIARELSSVVRIAKCTAALGHVMMFAGRFMDACALAVENAVWLRDLGSQPALTRSMLAESGALLYGGRYEEAANVTSGALALLADEDTDDSSKSYGLWRMGDVMLARHAYAEARQLLVKSVDIHRQMRIEGRLQDVLTSLGYAAYFLGDTVLLRQCLAEAITPPAHDRLWYTAIRSILLASLVATAENQPARAVELYALTLTFPHVAKSAWYDEVIGSHIRQISAHLPQEIVSAAQQRGAQIDLWQTVVKVALQCCETPAL